MFLSVLSGSSHLQSFPLIVEQLGDVPGHPLHQVFGVVPLDFELTLLFVVNLQTEETASSISFGKEVTAEQLLVPPAGLDCSRRSVKACRYCHEPSLTPQSTVLAAPLASGGQPLQTKANLPQSSISGNSLYHMKPKTGPV